MMVLKKYALPGLTALLLSCAGSLAAAPLYWDAAGTTIDGISQGGVGNWATGNWDTGSTTGAWLAGSDALLNGTGGAVTLNSIIDAASISLAPTTGAYTLSVSSGANGSTVGSLNVTDSTLLLNGTTLAPTSITLNSGSVLQLVSTSLNTSIVLNGGAIGATNNNSSIFTGLFSGNDLLFNAPSISFGNVLTLNRAALTNTHTGNTVITNNFLQLSGFSLAGFSPFGTDAAKTVSLTASGGGAYNPHAGIVFAPTGTNSSYTIPQNFAFSASNGRTASFQANDGIYRLTGGISIATDSNAASIVKFITQYNGKSIFLDGPVSGSGKIVISDISGSYGNGEVHLNNSGNTFSGTIQVDTSNNAFGILTVGHNTAARYASIVLTGNVAGTDNGGRLRINAATPTVAGLSGSNALSAVFTTSATLQTLTVNTAENSTYAGRIGVTGTFAYNNSSNTTNGANLGLIKAGIGEWTLSGNNQYVGGTSIEGGKLIAASTNALGTGSVLIDGGTLQPTTALSGIAGLILADGTLDGTLGSITTTGSFDMAGGLWIVGSSSNALTASTFDITGGTIDLSALSTPDKTASGFNLINGNGFLSGVTFVGGEAGYSYDVDTSGNLLVSAIPEPTQFALLGVCVAAIALRRRRVAAS